MYIKLPKPDLFGACLNDDKILYRFKRTSNENCLRRFHEAILHYRRKDFVRAIKEREFPQSDSRDAENL